MVVLSLPFNNKSADVFVYYEANAVILDFNATLLFIVNNQVSHATVV